MHEQMLSSQAPSGSNGCRLEGRALAALVAVVLALGIQIGLLVSIATSEATQTNILAPSAVGNDAMAYCVLQGNVFAISADSPSSQRCEVAEATLPAAKGCTVAGGLNVMECYWAVQSMFCPKAMVGTIPGEGPPDVPGGAGNAGSYLDDK